jgi:hypothetical protein
MRDHEQAVQDAREAVVKAALSQAAAWDLFDQCGCAMIDCPSCIMHLETITATNRTARHLATLTATEGATDA